MKAWHYDDRFNVAVVPNTSAITLGCLIFASPKERSWDVRMMIPVNRDKDKLIEVSEQPDGDGTPADVKLTNLNDPQPNRVCRIVRRWILSAE